MEKILNYRPARYLQGKKNCYVVYSVTNPETGNFVYRRIKLNFIKSSRERKKYAEDLIKQLNAKLANGYNPFTHETAEKLVLLSEAVTDFLKQKRRDVETRAICADTFTDYAQHLRLFAEHIGKDCYCYKLKAATVNAFLDYIYIDKQRTAITRNHYLQTLKTFFTYCRNRDYIAVNPAEKIAPLRPGRKQREPIPENQLQHIFDYLRQHDKYYLLACYLLYGCFIRPSEICKLRLSALNFANQTIYISADISKNKKAQSVTIPHNIGLYMLDLEIYNYPSDYYIIGFHCRPAAEPCTVQTLRRRWKEIREKLSLPASYQFYSLKDSGITKMISMLDVAEVRDQARHHNISITDVYTDRTRKDGNDKIKRLNFEPGAKN